MNYVFVVFYLLLNDKIKQKRSSLAEEGFSLLATLPTYLPTYCYIKNVQFGTDFFTYLQVCKFPRLVPEWNSA